MKTGMGIDLGTVQAEADAEDLELLGMFRNRDCRLEDMVLVAEGAKTLEEILAAGEAGEMRMHLVRKEDIARRRKELRAMAVAGWTLLAVGSAVGLWKSATGGGIWWVLWLVVFEGCMLPYLLNVPSAVRTRVRGRLSCAPTGETALISHGGAVTASPRGSRGDAAGRCGRRTIRGDGGQHGYCDSGRVHQGLCGLHMQAMQEEFCGNCS